MPDDRTERSHPCDQAESAGLRIGRPQRVWHWRLRIGTGAGAAVWILMGADLPTGVVLALGLAIGLGSFLAGDRITRLELRIRCRLRRLA